MSASPPTDSDPAPPGRPVAFGPFVLDLRAATLRRDGRPVALRPRPFDVLGVLVRRAGELVTKDELLDAVWGTRFVTEGVIKTAVAELREALGDDAKEARWIHTVPRRGYRFVPDDGGGIAPAPRPLPPAAAAAAKTTEPPSAADSGPLVGRDDAMAALDRCWQAVAGGQRRVAFVSGDPGVGKSALAAAFVERLPEGTVVAHGQCVESFGRGEPYLPWLEALASLQASVDDLPQWLRRCAPSWLAQMPWLQDAAGRAAAAESGAAERMPREMAALLEQLAQRAPVVLVLEDLHWSDHASAQLIDFLARRRTAARVLVLCTFRATDLLLAEHPLADIRRELRLHRLADEIGLDGLDAAGLRRLLGHWCPGVAWSAPALAALHEHTEGVPLFARAVVDALAVDGVLRPGAAGHWQLAGPLPQPLPLPHSLAGLFEKQFVALAPHQRELLEAAAVAGVEFDAATLAAALDRDAGEVHARCDGLVRGGRWLHAAGTEIRAVGPPSGRYRFGHALMHSLCYARCGGARRVELHRRVAQVLQQRHGDAGGDHAAALAYHFEQALDAAQALPALRRAIALARERQAPREVLALAERGLALLRQAGASVPDADRWRIPFAHSRASAIGLIDGYAADALGGAAAELVQAYDALPLDEDGVNSHRVLWLHHVVRGRFDAANEVAERVVARAAASGSATLEVQALSMLHFSAFKRGEFARARQAIDRADALAPEVRPRDLPYARFFAQQAHERALLRAMIDTLQGHDERRPDVAALRELLPQHYTPLSRALNGVLLGLWLAWTGEAQAVAEESAEVLALIEREELTIGHHRHRALQLWAEGAQGDAGSALPLLQGVLDALAGAGDAVDLAAFHELAADLALRAGDVAQATACIDAAFAHVRRTGERYLLPRLWARRAQLAERGGDAATAARLRARERQARADPAGAPLD